MVYKIQENGSDPISVFFDYIDNTQKYFRLDGVLEDEKVSLSIPKLIMFPLVLVPVSFDNKTPWDIYLQVVLWIKNRDDSICPLISPIILWLLKCATNRAKEYSTRAKQPWCLNLCNNHLSS